MSTPKPSPEFISLDIEQWRRNIHAFSDTTRKALDAIADELSNHCASGTSMSFPAPGRHERPQREEKARSLESPQRTLDKPSVDDRKKVKEPSQPSVSGSSDSRLSDLKSKLAQRLAKQ